MKATAKKYGWRYDASSAGDFQIWPPRRKGVWDFPLQMLPYEDGKYQGAVHGLQLPLQPVRR